MDSLRRCSPALAAAIVLVSAMGMATPTSAADQMAAKDTLKKDVLKKDILRPLSMKPHFWCGSRRAVARPTAIPDRAIATSNECSGIWCGRQFVLMLGIGF